MLQIFLIVQSFILVTENIIIELNVNDFHSEIVKHETSLVVFYAPWCGQCTKLLQKLPELERKLQESNLLSAIFKVDCENEGKPICQEFNIGGYPMLRSFRKDKEYGKYEGNRDVTDILKFVKEESAPLLIELKNFTGLEQKLREENRVCLVAKLKKHSKLEIIFNALAEKLRRRLSFIYSYHENGDSSWIKLYQQYTLWNKFENFFIEYNGEENISDIESFIQNNFHGLVGFRTRSNSHEFSYYPLVVAYFNVDYLKNPKGTNYWRNRIIKVAQKYKDMFRFAVSSKEEFVDELRNAGIASSPGGEKPVIIVFFENSEKFLLRDNFSVEIFDLFLHNVMEGKIKPYLRSKRPPERNDSYVVVAVGSTFYDLVINNPYDTMVKLYAKWCGHCKHLEPVYKDLAEIMKDENVTFIEIDAVENDVPVAYTPEGYPTIYWSTKGYRMNPIKYKGDRSIEDFIKFVSSHASSELDAYDREGKPKTKKVEL